MARPNGVFKRQPDLGGVGDAQRRYAAISKAQWAELYRDLYIQTHGEEPEAFRSYWLSDAEARLETLKANGLAGG
jgi:hypothetical protein